MDKSKYLVHVALILIGIVLISCTSEELTSAKLYIQQKNWEKAEEFLLKALVVEPENPEVPYLLGDLIYAKQENWEKMNEMFEKALQIGQDRRILQGATVKEYVDQSRNKNWALVYNEGVESFNKYRKMDSDDRQETLENSIQIFNNALLINPEESQTYAILSTCYYEDGEHEKSISHIKKAVELDPDNFNINLTAGQILSNNDDKEGALPYLIKAVELEPNNSKAIRHLAQTYYDLGQLGKSIETYEYAIKNETDRKVKADLYFNLGILYMQDGDYEFAEDSFMMVLDMNPEDVDALMGIAQTFETAEKWRRAGKFYKELIMLEPDNPDHYRGMSRVLLQQGRPEEAQRYFDKSKKVGD